MKSFVNLAEIKKSSKNKKVRTFIPEEVYVGVSIKENGEKLVDIETYFKKKTLDIAIELDWDKRDIPMCLVRESIARKLAMVSRRLQKNNPELILKIIDGYRPIRLQKRLFRSIYSDMLNKNKNLSEQELYLEVTKFIADPKNNPPHSTGGAVDVTIVHKKNGRELNMGNKINSISFKSQTFATIEHKAKKNRKLLFDLMTDAGFVNVPTEWWHYSYGDQYWAAFCSKKYAKFKSL